MHNYHVDRTPPVTSTYVYHVSILLRYIDVVIYSQVTFDSDDV